MDWDFQSVLSSIPAALFRGYPDGSVDLFDRKAEALTGYTKEEFEAKELRVSHGQRVLDPVTLSIGLAVYPENGTTPEALLQSADVALYRAKKEGRDRVCEAVNG